MREAAMPSLSTLGSKSKSEMGLEKKRGMNRVTCISRLGSVSLLLAIFGLGVWKAVAIRGGVTRGMGITLPGASGPSETMKAVATGINSPLPEKRITCCLNDS
jgi:hypothetical protein